MRGRLSVSSLAELSQLQPEAFCSASGSRAGLAIPPGAPSLSATMSAPTSPSTAPSDAHTAADAPQSARARARRDLAALPSAPTFAIRRLNLSNCLLSVACFAGLANAS